jgi:hypothetical protein
MNVADFEGREPTDRELVLYKVYLHEVNAINQAPIRTPTIPTQGGQGVIAAKDAVRPLAPSFHSFTQAERDDHELFCVGQRIKRTRCRICCAETLQETQDRAIAFAHEVRESIEDEPRNRFGKGRVRQPKRLPGTRRLVYCEVSIEDRRVSLGAYNDSRETAWARCIAKQLLSGDGVLPAQGIMEERRVEIERLVVKHLARQGFAMYGSFSGNNRFLKMSSEAEDVNSTTLGIKEETTEEVVEAEQETPQQIDEEETTQGKGNSGEHSSTPTNFSSGEPGVSWHKTTNQWRVRIVKGTTMCFARYFTDLSEAIRVNREMRAQIYGGSAQGLLEGTTVTTPSGVSDPADF